MTEGEAPSCFSVTLRRAMKEHRCCECPAPIVPGEMYELASGVWDHQGRAFKTCLPCAEVRQDFLKDLWKHWGYSETSIFGHLQVEMSEFYGN